MTTRTEISPRAVFLLAAVISTMWLAPSPLGAVPASSPPRVLILDETVLGGTNSAEAVAAQLALPTCVVDLVSAANLPLVPASGLGGPTGFGFDQYRAFIIGDPKCATYTAGYLSAITALNATKTTWNPQMTGNLILLGTDDVLHSINGYNFAGADKTVKRSVAFAIDDPTRTGLYYSLSCYYGSTVPAVTPAPVQHLTGFGNFMVWNYNYDCLDIGHIVATHPVFTATPSLSDADLSGWGCSTHEGFTAWPASFTVLAIAQPSAAYTYTATDGSNGIPYILIRGSGIQAVTSLDLQPPLATNNLGTTHTVCAIISTNVTPRTNVAVTFNIVSGPNAVTNYASLTAINGMACFTYPGLGGPGIDYITASFVPVAGTTNTSGTVEKVWAETCVHVGCEDVECQADGTYAYTFCLTNLSAAPLTSVSFTNALPGVVFTPGTLNLPGVLNPGQGTVLTLTISATGGQTNLCYELSAHQESPGSPSCTTPHCLSLPACCNRVVTNKVTYASASGSVTTYSYQLTVQNIGGAAVKFVAFTPDQACLSFVPPLIDLSLPAFGGPGLLLPAQTRTLNLQVQKTAPCPGTNSFHLSMLTTNLIACCSTKVKLPNPNCIFLTQPYDGTVVLTNTPVALRAIGIPTSINPCPLGTVLFYQDGALVGSAGKDPYQITVTPALPGTYSFTAVGVLSTGESQTSDPVSVTVLAPVPDTSQDHGGPGH